MVAWVLAGAGTSGGGDAMWKQRMASRTNTPRVTGPELSALAWTVRNPARVMTPLRCAGSRVTGTNPGSVTVMP